VRRYKKTDNKMSEKKMAKKVEKRIGEKRTPRVMQILSLHRYLID